MKNSLLFALLLSSCAGSAVTVPECELGVSRPFSVTAKRKGEVYIERNTREGCVMEERLVWKKSSIPLHDPEWQAGALSMWKGQVALDLHKLFEGHPVECKTRLYRFGKSKLEFVRANKTCGP